MAIEFIIFAIISYLSNSFMDAIAFHKGNRKLNHVWHFCKWLIFFPCWFLVGAYFISPDAWWIIINRLELEWFWLLLFWIFLHCIWEISYRGLRKLFKKWGDLPDWF